MSHLWPNYHAPVVNNCCMVNLSNKPFNNPLICMKNSYKFSKRAFLYFQQLIELPVSWCLVILESINIWRHIDTGYIFWRRLLSNFAFSWSGLKNDSLVWMWKWHKTAQKTMKNNNRNCSQSYIPRTIDNLQGVFCFKHP